MKAPHSLTPTEQEHFRAVVQKMLIHIQHISTPDLMELLAACKRNMTLNDRRIIYRHRQRYFDNKFRLRKEFRKVVFMQLPVSQVLHQQDNNQAITHIVI